MTKTIKVHHHGKWNDCNPADIKILPGDTVSFYGDPSREDHKEVMEGEVFSIFDGTIDVKLYPEDGSLGFMVTQITLERLISVKQKPRPPKWRA